LPALDAFNHQWGCVVLACVCVCVCVCVCEVGEESSPTSRTTWLRLQTPPRVQGPLLHQSAPTLLQCSQFCCRCTPQRCRLRLIHPCSTLRRLRTACLPFLHLNQPAPLLQSEWLLLYVHNVGFACEHEITLEFYCYYFLRTVTFFF
jgi:hypothetical protein